MKKTLMAAAALAAAMTAAASPAEKAEPVAPGFPAWTGLTAKNYVAGRQIEPSDLRHKVTIVVELEMNEKLVDQITEANNLLRHSTVAQSAGHGDDWANAELMRDVIAAVSLRNATPKDAQAFADILANKERKVADKAALSAFRSLLSQSCSVYRDLTFAGAPETEGKRPYAYVFGPTGAEPLAHGPLVAAQKDLQQAFVKARQTIRGWDDKWRPFFGNVPEPQFNTSVKKALEKGRTARKVPLAAVEKALLADVRSSDEAKAREAQVLYDALVQTRSDLILRIGLECSSCPHVAYRDLQTLLKYWPSETRRLGPLAARVTSNGEGVTLGKMFCKLMDWRDPAFTCKPSEAKKIVVELKKMKKQLAPYKQSQTIVVQNAALLMDMQIDNLIPAMQARAETK